MGPTATPSRNGGVMTMAEVLAAIEADAQRETRSSGLHRTGFEVLDHVLEGGIRNGHLTLVGGPPGVGKTVATLQWARNIAAAGVPAIYVCYEHDERSLFARVLHLEVGSLPDGGGAPTSGEMRRILRAVTRSERSVKAEVAGNLPLRAACANLARYQHRLSLVRADARFGLAELEDLVAAQHSHEFVLFVDYLQKVASPGTTGLVERIAMVAEGLKDLALSRDIAIVAVVAGDDQSLSQMRTRLHHIQGGSALAYEADVIIMLNDKIRAVSRAHTAFDPVAAERFRRQVVFTVEKNRDGPSSINVQFDKDFEHYRFDPEGSAVQERLIDDHFYIS